MDQATAGALFDKVTDLYRDQVWLPEDRAWGHPLLAAVTLATHHANKVSDWFILDLEGPTASGKSEAAKVLRRTGYRVRRIAVAPTVPQLYRYTNKKRGEEPRVTIFDELHLRAGNRDALAILNGGLSRESVVTRTINGKDEILRPWGIKVLVHEGTLPRPFHSLRRRCIRVQTAQNEDYTPKLVTSKELNAAIKALRPDLNGWRGARLKKLINKWRHNKGTVNGQWFQLSAVERPIWPLVLAVAEYCDRLDAVIPALDANRTGRELNVARWWIERALPRLKELDPAGMSAAELLDEMREHFGADIPTLGPTSLGQRLRRSIAAGKLAWETRKIRGQQRYWRRRKRRPLNRGGQKRRE